MSTFPGLVEEIPGISVDCFSNENLNSSLFFLSHCHTDHMKGLSTLFFKNLFQTNRNLYCSHISKAFLISKFNLCNELTNNIIELSLDESRIIDYVCNDVKSSFVVSCVSSGHCPGSIMFLFTLTNDTNILYTGDFRINIKDFPKLKILHNKINLSTPKKIQKMYLDTTFLDPGFYEFPDRTESFNSIIPITEEWIKKNPKNLVVFEISANYGYEFLFMELYKKLKEKIHVKDFLYDTYSRMNGVANCVSMNKNTRLHACTKKGYISEFKCIENVEKINILTIIVSCFKWKNKNTSFVVEKDVKKNTINLCYSTHASYQELEAFIEYFKPNEIYPCVCNEEQSSEVYSILKKIMSQYQNNAGSSRPEKIRFPKHTNNFKRLKTNIISDSDSDSNDE